jgi:glutamate dehydrogenase (NAD(P)+)
VNTRLEQILGRAFAQVMGKVEADKVPHRTAAMAIGVEKLWRAKRTRGLFP